MRRAFRLTILLDLIDLKLDLRHSLELNVKLAPHLIDNLTALVE